MIRRFLSKFMQGRYGFDKLSFALTLFGFLLGVVISILRLPLYSLIYSRYWVYILFNVLHYLSYLPYIIAICRALSRNFDKRRREEAAFMSFAGNWIDFFTKKMKQKKDREHRYFNCPSCHRTLRVPTGRGKILIDCPHCGKQFKKRT